MKGQTLLSEALNQLAENIWILPRDKHPNKVQPNVGIICTSTQTVLVDCGNSPYHAQRLLAALKHLNAPPISQIIYTHHHWDHIFGASTFGVPVIAHELCQQLLTQHIQQRGGLAALKTQIQQNEPGTHHEVWDHFQIILPDITFSHQLTLPLDGLTLELEHVGGVHAADSIVVRVKESHVMFIGDCYYPPPGYLQSSNKKTSWSMLSSFLDEKAIDVYVDGHSDPLKKSDLLKRWGIKFLASL
ncbi:MBL fold metallo-hydrolase [Ktedonospora formicarum]|nr:MBL fold metallo-hydrolase [Ktedonospora formicarum]